MQTITPARLRQYNILLGGFCLLLLVAWGWMVYQAVVDPGPNDFSLTARIGLESINYLLPLLAAGFVLLARNARQRAVVAVARGLAFGLVGLNLVYQVVMLLTAGLYVLDNPSKWWWLAVVLGTGWLPLHVFIAAQTRPAK
jgi:hypothetical protein